MRKTILQPNDFLEVMQVQILNTRISKKNDNCERKFYDEKGISQHDSRGKTAGLPTC